MMASEPWSWESGSEADTQCVGRAVAELAAPGDVLALHGDLGAGKTRLAQAVIAGLGVEDDVISPTFVLVREYCGRLPVFHLDAYRLRDEDEFAELGPEEMFAAGGVVLIEWADRVTALLPDDRLEIALETTGLQSRCLTFTACGPRAERLLCDLRRRLAD